MNGNKYVTCEFKVLFDKNKIARSFYWKPESCANLIRPKPVASPPPPPAPLPDKPIRLSAGTLFGFDKYQLTTAGKHALDGLVDKIRSASQIENIRVVGYTDRIGTDGYNMQLSKERADAVRDYLVANGVPAGAIATEGRGEADPIVACEQPGSGNLIACLAPNRRVEISGEAKIDQ
ncbi:MAG TPA: OmpA family protein [Oleiagrimonas sp.]|nr:OmpA family protein [Oleiagrimonas sp.]